MLIFIGYLRRVQTQRVDFNNKSSNKIQVLELRLSHEDTLNPDVLSAVFFVAHEVCTSTEVLIWVPHDAYSLWVPDFTGYI